MLELSIDIFRSSGGRYHWLAAENGWIVAGGGFRVIDQAYFAFETWSYEYRESDIVEIYDAALIALDDFKDKRNQIKLRRLFRRKLLHKS